MKIGICGDVHWSEYSSILRQRKEKYSLRLENLIQSVMWYEELADSEHCDMSVYLGDFFDKSDLSPECITALNDVKWGATPKYFLVGNHEMGRASLEFSSAHLLNMIPRITVIDRPGIIELPSISLCFLPYQLPSTIGKLNDYFLPAQSEKVVFSHNDIAGISYGPVVSREGFDLKDLESSCKLFLNGHIHNGEKVAPNVINVGNLTGQNFSEDAFKYEHSALIYDTDTGALAVYRNPYALNFYKLDFTKNSSIEYINDITSKVGRNAVVTVRCYDDDAYVCIRTRFDPAYGIDNGFPKHCGVLASKFIIERVTESSVDTGEIDFSVDHLNQFRDYVLTTLGNSETVVSELQEVCK